jgi:hypothetical protein
VLRGSQQALEDAKMIRNAVAHDSEAARVSFESVVRRELNAVPAGVTVGGFLERIKPGSRPPMSFLARFENVATRSGGNEEVTRMGRVAPVRISPS